FLLDDLAGNGKVPVLTPGQEQQVTALLAAGPEKVRPASQGVPTPAPTLGTGSAWWDSASMKEAKVAPEALPAQTQRAAGPLHAAGGANWLYDPLMNPLPQRAAVPRHAAIPAPAQSQ